VALFSVFDGFYLNGGITTAISGGVQKLGVFDVPDSLLRLLSNTFVIRALYWMLVAAVPAIKHIGMHTEPLSDVDKKQIGRIIYGVVCFAMFFSFFGTVLGGLWADDSWGRFWGWDPKENGALIIVLWNAFILHAKWDKLANERGLAVLALVGNIVTCWSWFGTNQLGVGLHSYGFTQGVLLALGITVLVHLVLIGIGLLPKRLWWSYQARANEALAVA
jgi:cytochrome c biogenesis factor